MKEVNIIAEQARAIGLHVGLTHSNDKPKEKNLLMQTKKQFKMKNQISTVDVTIVVLLHRCKKLHMC